MSAAVTVSKTELGDSRVRVAARVEPQAVDREVERAAQTLAREVKLPGFRKGKVPAPVVIQRMGREAVLDEAIRRALPTWYAQAIAEAGVVTIGDPKVDLADLPEKGSPLEFSFEVGVRPAARLGEYRGLEVGRREPQVSPEDIDAELERLRESVAALETVERAAQQGDFIVLDFVGRIDGEPFEGGEARGYMVELGSGRLVGDFERQLVGAGAGDERRVQVDFPDDYRAEQLAGKRAEFEVSVKEVKEKRVPELDDDFALEAGGFDSVAELRADLEARLREVDEARIEREYREAAVDAAVSASTVELPDELVHAKAHEMWHATASQLRAQGLDPAGYLRMLGKDEEEFVSEHEDDARGALARESVLAAIVAAEGIEIGDDDLLDALREAGADAQGGKPSERAVRKTLERAREAGRDDLLREDIAMRRAVDAIVEHAKPIAAERARAREELWTPEKDSGEAPRRLWTPDSG
jgi:trigger factor